MSAETFQWWAKGTTTHEMVLHTPALAGWAAFRVGTHGGNGINLWKATCDALGPLLGEPRVGREFHPADDRVVDLAFHLTADHTLLHDVGIAVSCHEVGA